MPRMVSCLQVLSALISIAFVSGQVRPSVTPTVNVVSIFSNNITIRWNHTACPACVDDIRSYDILYGPSGNFPSINALTDTVSVPGNTNVGDFLSFTVTGLVPTERYSIQVRSRNARGPGPYSVELRLTTLEPTFLIIQLKLHDVSNCLQWRELVGNKLNTIRQSLAIEVNKVCSRCQLNDEGFENPSQHEIFLRGANFMCFPRSVEHQVTFRTQVLDVSTATAQEIVTSLQQWMRSPPPTTEKNLTITVDFNRYYVNNCPLIISNFDDPECSDFQTSFSAAVAMGGGTGTNGASNGQSTAGVSVGGVVGAVIGVALIMAVTGIIVVVVLLVFLRKRESSYTTLSRGQPDSPRVMSTENTTSLSTPQETKTTANYYENTSQ